MLYICIYHSSFSCIFDSCTYYIKKRNPSNPQDIHQPINPQPPGFHRSQGHTASADAMHSAARGIWEAYVDAMKAIDAMDEGMEL